jgi:hypothetical protein
MREQELRITAPAEAGLESPRRELCGPWLEEAGFRVGSRVEVEVVDPGRLVVTRVDVRRPGAGASAAGSVTASFHAAARSPGRPDITRLFST